MKIIYTIILSLFIGSALQAQQVPNGNFEQWAFDSGSMSFQPVGWQTSNVGSVGDTGTYRFKPAYAGNYACGLKTSFVLNTFAAPAMLQTTFPIGSKPETLELYFKGNIAANDTSIIIVEFGQDTNIIADGSMFITQSQSNYTKLVIPIDFFGSGNPDSCTITILSGGFEIDDTLTSIAVDNIAFTYPVNTRQVYFGAKENICLYPNPATDVLNIRCTDAYEKILLFNSTGTLVCELGSASFINVTDLRSGMYLMQLMNGSGQVVGRQTFLKN